MLKHRIASFCLLAFFVCFFTGCYDSGIKSEAKLKLSNEWVPSNDDLIEFAEKNVTRARKDLISPHFEAFSWSSQNVLHLEKLKRFRVNGKFKTKNASSEELTHEYSALIEYDSDAKTIELHTLQVDGRALYATASLMENPDSLPTPQLPEELRRKDDSAENEEAASKLMKYVMSIKKKQPVEAKKWLKRIIERYPDTEVAKEAKRMIEAITP